MTTKLEIQDQKRTTYRRGHVTWLFVFVIAWIVRSGLKIFELDMDLLHTILLIPLLLSVSFQAFYALKDNLLKREISNDPILKEALNDELFQLNELKAWRTAFFCLIGYIIFVAILSLFITYNDIMLIFITALLIGFGSYNTTVYILNR
ncbi:hypothetical protein ACFLZW_01520 [Chloroflexota bacterium]